MIKALILCTLFITTVWSQPTNDQPTNDHLKSNYLENQLKINEIATNIRHKDNLMQYAKDQLVAQIAETAIGLALAKPRFSDAELQKANLNTYLINKNNIIEHHQNSIRNLQNLAFRHHGIFAPIDRPALFGR